MVLTDVSIRWYMQNGNIKLDPKPELNCFQPASVELTLGNTFDFPGEQQYHYADINGDLQSLPRKEFAKKLWTDICLRPGEFILGHTEETLTLADNICAQVNGKSSLGRIGLLVHATAGFVDPGFHGQITLELKNLSSQPIWLQHGMKIAQLVFLMTSRKAERPYGHPDLGSHYQDQQGTTRSYLEAPNGIAKSL